ncbi:MAG TPA: hypothetical protein DDZ80_21570 [Cyanobacteria bacterium UBA8803]|nr:hypothetical protein [Cyanobacteria bacterium UBA9273]HBL60924.1 hypothetical protein [Cyanobacteria bacterium UBA8803]
MLSLTATFADFMPKSLSVLNQIEEVIKTAVNEVRHSASFFKSLPDEEFDVVFCERQGEWWEVHVKVLTPFSRQSWLHKISIDAQVGEAVGAVVDVY